MRRLALAATVVGVVAGGMVGGYYALAYNKTSRDRNCVHGPPYGVDFPAHLTECVEGA